MSLQQNRKLLRELQMVGASARERRELAAIAGRLGALQHGHVAKRQRFWTPRLALVGAVAAIALLAVTVLAQSSLPGSWLYPTKRLSENVAVAVVPSYRVTLMMRRADEVQQLIARQASTKTVQSTLQQYQVEAAGYKGSNYPAYEHCKRSLQQAQARANPAEQALIASVLRNLGDIR